jgi:hypothetical protein
MQRGVKSYRRMMQRGVKKRLSVGRVLIHDSHRTMILKVLHTWFFTWLSLEGPRESSTVFRLDSLLHHAAVRFDSPLHHAAVRFDSPLLHAAERFDSPLQSAAARFDSQLHNAAEIFDSPLQNAVGKCKRALRVGFAMSSLWMYI